MEKELLLLGQLLKDPKVFLAVLNPCIKCSTKNKSLKGIIRKERFPLLIANMMNLLVQNGYLSNTQGVISAFPTTMSIYHKNVSCMVTTASSVDKAVLSNLKTVLKNLMSKLSIKMGGKDQPVNCG